MTRQNAILRHALIGLSLCISLTFFLQTAAAKETRGDRMLKAYFRAEVNRVAKASTPGTGSLDEWKAEQKVLRAQLFEMLGLDPLPKKTDLKATVTDTIERDGIIVEKLHFQSLPKLYVTANLYRPAKVDKPLPTILYLCGHGGEKEGNISFGNKTHYRHHGAWFAQHGYVCLMLDTVQKGEIEGIHNGTRTHGRWWWNNRGYTPSGVETWNCIRALDYLDTRPEVDKKRIGATGRSGGGTYTWRIAALDDRIAVAAPVAGMTDLQNHILDNKIRNHCDCNFFINTYEWDFPTLAALVAPRPLLICNTDSDPIFPLDGVKRIYNKVRHVYQLYGKENNVRLFTTPGKHEDLPPLQVAVFEWFNKYLKNDTTPVKDPAKALFTRQELRVFDKLPKDQINTKIDELFVPQAEISTPRNEKESKAHYESTKKTLLEKVFSGWPKEPCDLDVKRVNQKVKEGRTITTYEYTSQEHVRLPLYVVGPTDPSQVDTIDIRLTSEKEWKALKAGLCDKATPKDGAAKTEKKNAFVRVFVPTRGIGPTRWSGKKREQVRIRRSF
ncbi:MAG: alpha/beta hydrolase family protein, partial [Planctomycetia bacterium]